MTESNDRDPRLAELYRQGAQEQPSAELNRLILQAARDELGQQSARRRRRSRFTVPLSAAAGLLLAVGLARLVLQEVPETAPLGEMAPAGSRFDRSPTPQAPTPEAHTPAPLRESAAPLAEPVAPEPRLRLMPPQVLSKPEIYDSQNTAREGVQAPAATKAQAAPAPVPAETARTASKESAELAQIRALLQQGEEEEARRRLQLLRQANPELVVPADLEGLLQGDDD